jgi:hypothetical protein
MHDESPRAPARLRIVSDGERSGTRIFLGDEDMSRYIDKIEWVHKGGELPRAVAHLALVEVNVSGSLKLTGPAGDVRMILYEDKCISSLGDGYITKHADKF